MSAKKANRKGFTIIELMLAMGFLSALLVVIALLAIQITGIYQKGLSLRAVSSVGKQLIDEFSRAVGGAPIVTITAKDNYFFANEGGGRQMNGGFCTGSYSYLWNTWYSYEEDRAAAVTIKRGPADTVEREPFKLARVRDDSRQVCQQLAEGKRVVEVPEGVEPIELLSVDEESNLILYDMTVFPASQHNLTKHTFYSATFILGTMRGDINIHSAGDYCDVEGGSELGLTTSFNYCAVNRFNFAMRATGFTDQEDQYGNRYGEGGV